MKRITREIGNIRVKKARSSSSKNIHIRIITTSSIRACARTVSRIHRTSHAIRTAQKPQPIVTDTLTERPVPRLHCALGRSPVRVRSRKDCPQREDNCADASSLKTQSGLFAARVSGWCLRDSSRVYVCAPYTLLISPRGKGFLFTTLVREPVMHRRCTKMVW